MKRGCGSKDKRDGRRERDAAHSRNSFTIPPATEIVTRMRAAMRALSSAERIYTTIPATLRKPIA